LEKGPPAGTKEEEKEQCYVCGGIFSKKYMAAHLR
jgi:tRNA U54 and U55 pseudouridine synthase Pus10